MVTVPARLSIITYFERLAALVERGQLMSIIDRRISLRPEVSGLVRTVRLVRGKDLHALRTPSTTITTVTAA